MFNYLRYLYNEKQWEIYIAICIIIILCIWFYNKIQNIEGKWTQTIDWKKCKYIDKYECKDNTESIGEFTCRKILNNYLKKPFIKVRNIYNPVTNQFLELDCYNEELQLAVEYQGIQHYKFCPYFHKNKESFRNQQYRDELKRIYCKNLGITLIEVPYTIKKDEIEGYLYQKFVEYGYIYPKYAFSKQ